MFLLNYVIGMWINIAATHKLTLQCHVVYTETSLIAYQAYKIWTCIHYQSTQNQYRYTGFTLTRQYAKGMEHMVRSVCHHHKICQIVISMHLSYWQKMDSLCFESFGKANKCQKILFLLATPIDCRSCVFCSCTLVWWQWIGIKDHRGTGCSSDACSHMGHICTLESS